MLRPPTLAAGATVGRFEVVRHLASGGMGELYEARDPATGERAALKVVGALDPAAAVRFERERRLSAQLDHPHVVRGLGGALTPEGLPWFAMELLAGEDLEARLRRGPLPVADAVELGAQVCDALAYAHARGVVHRDLKPSNLFLVRGAARARVKLLDFGVAHVPEAATLTRSNAPVGTPAYMAPEQARGERGVDARADVWGLGVVLYECLAGRRPFVADSAIGVLFQVLDAVPPRLDALSDDIPPVLADVVERAMEKERDRRFPDAAALRAALAEVPRNISVAPARPSAVPPPPAALLGVVETVELGAEQRLAAVALLDGVRDARLVEAVARELRGRVERLAGERVLVLFGLDRWSGDEPLRAVRLARTALGAACAASVATGRVLRGAARVVGLAIDDAARRLPRAGLAVDPTTLELVRHDAALVVSDDGAVRPAPAALHSLAPGTYDTPFVGRDVELGLLLRCAERAGEEARPCGVAFVAPPGFGKSRLRHEAAQRLRGRAPGATFVAARGDPFRADAPFAALRDAFAAAFDPSVAALFDAAPGADPVAALDGLRGALASLLADAAERGPVVLSVDDAQWLDAASREAIRWLREAAPDLPLALWAFARPEAPDLAALVGEAAPAALGPLDAPAAEELARALVGDAPAALVERAAGHPLFLEELARIVARREPGARVEDVALPPSVEGAWLAEIDRMPPGERDFLKRAAVFGRGFWVEGVAAVGGDPAAAAPLRAAGLVVPRARSRVEGAREMRFRVGLLQETAALLLPDDARARLHEGAARWLAGRAGATPDELARHWERAGLPDRAAAAHADAAARAASLADTATACAHADRALALSDDAAVQWRALCARDDALQLTDQVALAREGVARIEALAERLDLRHRVEAAWRRCYAARLSYDREGAVDAGRRALALAASLGEARWLAAVGVDLAMALVALRRVDEALAAAERSRDDAARAGDGWLVARAAGTEAFVRVEAGDVAAGVALYEGAAAGFARAGDRRREAVMNANVAWALLRLGRAAEAERACAAATEAARRVGNSVTATSCAHLAGVLRRLAGDLDAADALQAQAADGAARRGNRRLECSAAVERAYVALARGGDARAYAAEAMRLAADARSSGLEASARAVGLRAEATEEGVAAARALVGRVDDPECRAELLAALADATGDAAGASAARDALDALAERAGADERDGLRALLARRYGSGQR